MYKLIFTSRAKKDLKKYTNNKSDFEKITTVLEILSEEGFKGIPINMKPHKLKGQYNDLYECHIKPDLLIIWLQIENDNTISIVRIGSHSELF